MSLLDANDVAMDDNQIGDAELYQKRRNMCIDPLTNPHLASHPLISDGTLINDIKEPSKPSLRLSSLGHRNLINYTLPDEVIPTTNSIKIEEKNVCFYCDAPEKGTCPSCGRYYCKKHSDKHRHHCKGPREEEENIPKKVLSTLTDAAAAMITTIVKPMSLINPETDIEMEPSENSSSKDEVSSTNNDDDIMIISEKPPAPTIVASFNTQNGELIVKSEDEENSSCSDSSSEENSKVTEVSRLVEYTNQLQFEKDRCDFQKKQRKKNPYKPTSLEEKAERDQQAKAAFRKFREKRKKKRLRKEKKLGGKRPKRKCLENIDLRDPLIKKYQNNDTSLWDPDYNDNDSGIDSEEERMATKISVDLTRDLSDPSSEEDESDEENMGDRCINTETGESSKMPEEPAPDSEPEDAISTSKKRKSSSAKKSSSSASADFKIPTDLIIPPVSLNMKLLGKALKPDEKGSFSETPWLPEKAGKSVLTSVPRKILPDVEGISPSDLKKKSLRKRIEAALKHRIHRSEGTIKRAKHKISLAKKAGKKVDKETLRLSKESPFNLGIVDFIKYNIGWVLHASTEDVNKIWTYAVVAVHTPKKNTLLHKLVVVPLGLLKLIFPARVPCFKTGIALARGLMIKNNNGITDEFWMPHWEAMHETSKTHKQGNGCLVTAWPTRKPSDSKSGKRFLPTMDSRLVWTHMKSNPFGSIKVKVCKLIDLTTTASSAPPPHKKQKKSKVKNIKKEKEKVKATEEPPEEDAVTTDDGGDDDDDADVIKKVNNLGLKTICDLLEFADFDSTNVNMSNQQLCDRTVGSHRIMTTSPQAIGLYLEANMIMKTSLKRKAPPRVEVNSLKSDTMIAMGTIPENGRTQIGERLIPTGAQTVKASIAAQKHLRRVKAKAAIKNRKGIHRHHHQEKKDSKAALLAASAIIDDIPPPPPKKEVIVAMELDVQPPPKKKAKRKKEHRPVSGKHLETSLIKASYKKCNNEWWKLRDQNYFVDFCDPLIRALNMAQQKGELAKLLLNRLQIQSGGLDDLLGKICKIIHDMKNQTSQKDVRSSFLKIIQTYFGIKDAARGMICGLILVQRAYGIKDSTDEKEKPEEEMDDFMLAMLGNGEKDVSESDNPIEMTYTGAMLLIMHESIVKSRTSKGVDRDQTMAFFEKTKAWIQTDLDVHGVDGFGLNLLARAARGETEPIILVLIWLMLDHDDSTTRATTTTI